MALTRIGSPLRYAPPAGGGGEQLVQPRVEHDADDRLAVDHEADVDAVRRHAVDVVGGPVERIDDPHRRRHRRPAAATRSAGRRRPPRRGTGGPGTGRAGSP